MRKISLKKKKVLGDPSCTYCKGEGKYPSKGVRGEALINLGCPWCKDKKEVVVEDKPTV